MTVGLAIVGTGMLLMERITPGMPYSALWWNLLMMGIGMGLVMTPMTAAVMNAVPRRRAGMASATSNASREVGGVFGIALLGAIVTHFFASDLRGSLEKLPLPAGVKNQIVALAGQGGGTAKGSLPTGLDPQALHHIVDNAFVSGMHVAFWVSAGILLTGSVVAAVFVHKGVPDVASEAFTPAEESSAQAGADSGRRAAGAQAGRRRRAGSPLIARRARAARRVDRARTGHHLTMGSWILLAIVIIVAAAVGAAASVPLAP